VLVDGLAVPVIFLTENSSRPGLAVFAFSLVSLAQNSAYAWPFKLLLKAPQALSLQHYEKNSFGSFVVLVDGLEPSRYYYHGILSPTCLPIPPHQLIHLISKYCQIKQILSILNTSCKYKITMIYSKCDWSVI
jgi:hypothetical protein